MLAMTTNKQTNIAIEEKQNKKIIVIITVLIVMFFINHRNSYELSFRTSHIIDTHAHHPINQAILISKS